MILSHPCFPTEENSSGPELVWMLMENYKMTAQPQSVSIPVSNEQCWTGRALRAVRAVGIFSDYLSWPSGSVMVGVSPGPAEKRSETSRLRQRNEHYIQQLFNFSRESHRLCCRSIRCLLPLMPQMYSNPDPLSIMHQRQVA
ncbi:hypothetical protein MHYP_G00175240 [Metynnis hypsauchen]